MLGKQNLQNLIDGNQFRKVMNKHFPKIKSLCHQDIHIKIDKCGLKNCRLCFIILTDRAKKMPLE